MPTFPPPDFLPSPSLAFPLCSKEKQLRVEEEHARSVAERSMPRDASRGLNSISRFVKERGIQ